AARCLRAKRAARSPRSRAGRARLVACLQLLASGSTFFAAPTGRIRLAMSPDVSLSPISSRRPPLALVVLAFAGLAGCATLAAPDRTLPETPVPAAWSAAAAIGQDASAASLAEWWRNFDDP